MAFWKKLKEQVPLSGPLGYGFAIAAVGLATFIRLLLDPHVDNSVPYAPYYLPIALTIWFTGAGPAVAAILLGFLVGEWLFVPPRYSFAISGPQLVAGGMFVVANFVVLAMAQALRRAKAQADTHAQTALKGQKELERAKWEWERTFDSVPDLIAILDPQHRIVRINRAMAARLGKTPHQCIGLVCHHCVHGLDQPPDFCPHQRTMEDGQEHLLEVFEPRAGGYFHVSTTPLLDENGQVIGSVHVARDINERKRMEMQLREMNQRLAAMFDHTHMLVACMDPAFNFLVVNRAYAQADHQEPDFFPGKNHFALYPNRENEAHFRAVVETGTPCFMYGKPFEYAHQPERGISYWDWSLIPIKDAQGQVVQLVSTISDVTKSKQDEAALLQAKTQLALANQDLEGKVQERTAQLESLNQGLQNEISERQRTEAALRRSEQRFRALFNATFEFLGLLTPEGIVLEINQTALDAVGASAEEVMRRPFWQTRWWSHSPALQQWLQEAIAQAAQGQPIRQEVEHVKSDGTRLIVDFSLKPIRDEHGEVILLLPEGRDITARKQMEQALRESVSALESFSYSISHDLRAPLRSIYMFATFVEEECQGVSDQAKDYSSRIVRSARRMDALIQDLLAYSRISRDDLVLKPVDPAKLLRDMLDTYPELQPSRADIALEGDFPAVLANEAALTQCFSNLLINAVKFVAPGQQPQIKVWAEPMQDHVRLWFKDNGIGVRPEYLEKIFGIFERLHTEYDGTGIGLAIVRKAAERMGGSVGVESEIGKGSSFWLELKGFS